MDTCAALCTEAGQKDESDYREESDDAFQITE